MDKFKKSEEIRFYLHDTEHTVKTDSISPNMTLNYYLRNILHLTGTKRMCHEGGCGSCVVVLQTIDPATKKEIFLAVNSCLISILSCNGWRIFTIEGIGDPLKGYHPIQQVLAKFNGTQCGYCSSGMVMNMYALHESNKLTMQEVENSFGGNICRCTGYRPILTAFKSLCVDATPEVIGQHPDIEDIAICNKEKCTQKCLIPMEDTSAPFYHTFGNSRWVKVYTMWDLISVINLNNDVSYKLVAGSTAQGVYKSYDAPVDVYVEITSVPDLKIREFRNGFFVVGASITLSEAIEIFTQTSQTHQNFAYLKQLAEHIDLIANTPVRNRGTIAGNLMIKHDHNEFPSDVFLLLEAVGALITIASSYGKETALKPQDFVSYDMSLKVVKNIMLPELSESDMFVSYKIMPRAQNVHAHVNAGFLFKFSQNGTIDSANIVFGNINPSFVHSKATEQLLEGKNLFDNKVLSQVYETLESELKPDYIPPDAAPEFRKQLAIALFYKAVLSIAPGDKVSPKNRSGGTKLERPVSKGVQDYQTNSSLYPLTQAIPKLEALAQTSGQAEYVDDKPDLPNQLFAALVLAKAAPNSIIRTINASKALANPNIVAFYSKDDIPGDNNFTPTGSIFLPSAEEIFCSGKVQYYEQPIGVLIGNNQNEVNDATKLVEVAYDSPNMAPLLSIRQILSSGRSERVLKYQTIKPKRKGNDVKHVIKGTFDLGLQYHFFMETQCCNVVPNEDGLDVYPTSQWLDMVQVGVARMLKIPANKILVTVRRCGGAFGGKISRNGLVTCAAALAAWKLRKPVKIWVPLSVSMTALGKRFPFATDYEVAVNDKGVVQYLNCTHYSDKGAVDNEDSSFLVAGSFTSNYNSDTYMIQINKVITDTHPNTYARAPGTTEGMGSIEAIMEHVAYAINVDPLQVRLANITMGSPLIQYVNDLKSWANIDKRKAEIAKFNKENRWKKKGLAVVPMNFHLENFGPFPAMVAILQGDGSVQVSHGGVEIGQGINTKVAQVCAYKLGIPLAKVVVIPSNSFVAANASITGGSITSEAICYGVISACDQLLARIQPFKNKMKDPTWEELIHNCYQNFVDLIAHGHFSPFEPNVSGYSIYGICACEVIVDILTGQHILTRVDLIEDTGQSMSPEIDIGQVEGAFIMGMGYYTMEQIVVNYEGKILTNNTWTYYPPGAKDIPCDFRVKFPKNNPNSVGVLKSKATGEPPFCMTVVVPLAIRNALASARNDANSSNNKWYPIDGPTTVENIFTNSANNFNQFVL